MAESIYDNAVLANGIHPLADVETKTIGEGTKIWRWTHVCKDVTIGKDCVIGQGCYIGPGVWIGDRVHIQNGCFIPELTDIFDDAFLGPNVVITNDKYPPSPKELWAGVVIGYSCSIGANSTIIAGVKLGTRSMVGAGSVVTRDVPIDTLVKGNPAE